MSLRNKNEIAAQFLKFGACKDGERTAEYRDQDPDKVGGYFTLSFLEAAQAATPSTSYQDILNSMVLFLQDRNQSQQPILSYSWDGFDPASESFALTRTAGGSQGTRRAVLIGINFAGMVELELDGAHNDVLRVKEFLTRQHAFLDKNIAVLLDDGKHVAPTSENIWKALLHLVGESVAGDSVFVHISSHVIQVPDQDGDELDGNDEVLVTLDSQNSILDDHLYSHFVCVMKAGVAVTILCDTCSSGSLFDLPNQCVA